MTGKQFLLSVTDVDEACGEAVTSQGPADERLPGPSSNGETRSVSTLVTLSSRLLGEAWGGRKQICQSMCSTTGRPAPPDRTPAHGFRLGGLVGAVADGGPDSGAWHLEAGL